MIQCLSLHPPPSSSFPPSLHLSSSLNVENFHLYIFLPHIFHSQLRVAHILVIVLPFFRSTCVGVASPPLHKQSIRLHQLMSCLHTSGSRVCACLWFFVFFPPPLTQWIWARRRVAARAPPQVRIKRSSPEPQSSDCFPLSRRDAGGGGVGAGLEILIQQ